MTRRAKPMLAIGPLSAKSACMPHYVSGHDFSDVYVQRWCNASMPAMSQQELQRVMPKAPARPGSEDHRRHQSRGV